MLYVTITPNRPKLLNKDIYSFFSEKILKSIFIVFFSILSLDAQNLQDIENIRKQYQEALKQQELQKPQEVRDAEETAKSTSLPDKVIYTRKEVESLIANTQKLLDRLNSLEDSAKSFPYIGYDIFSVRDSVPFWQNLPTPKDYTLGPGDEIIISLYGAIEQNISEIINRDGEVFLKDVGTLNLSGLTIEKANEYVKNKYSKIYSTLISSNPTTFFDITLGELKSINVHIVGFAVYPGIHIVHPFSSVFSALSQSGGVETNGSLRDIEIIRNGRVIAVVDLYKYLFSGKSLNDTRLLDQDIILIPPRKSTVAINGRIKSPGYYEIKSNENTKDLIDFSGGFSTLAQEHIFIINNDPKSRKSAIINRSSLKNISLADGDSVHVPIVHTFDEYITLEGSIKSPGKYPYQKDLSLRKLLEVDGSITDFTYIDNLDLKNISIFRRKENSKEIIQIPVDLTNIENDIILKRFDQISIPPNPQRKPLKSVKLTGEVKTQGLYNINNQKTLKDIIDLAGGLTKDALKKGIEVYRDTSVIAWENMNFFLEDGDSINVLKKTGTIQVLGEVHRPGYITYNKSYNVKKYLNLAGGINSYGDDRDVIVIQPNGKAVPMKKVRRKSILEGSKIIVHKKSLLGSARGPSGWQIFGTISSQASNIATTILTMMLLYNQTNQSNGS